MRINTNMIALTADRNLGIVQDELGRSTQRLSSGLRVNMAKDDAAAMTISEKMRSQIRAIDQAARNSQDGVSLIHPNAANQAMEVIDLAIDQVSAQRSNLGGAQNALEAIVANLNSSSENLHASESRIRDLDVANETVAFTKWQILSQAGTAA